MRNQSRAAAQTASIGNQDMMTFLPAEGGGGAAGAAQSPGGSGGDAASSPGMTAPAPVGSSTYATAPPSNNAGGSASANAVYPNNNIMGGGVPDPLRAGLNRGESMDDEAFNASLDALLKEAQCDAGGNLFDGGSTLLGDPTPPPVPALAAPMAGAMGNSGGGGRKRKSPPGGNMGRSHLVTEMSSLTNSSGDSMGGTAHPNNNPQGQPSQAQNSGQQQQPQGQARQPQASGQPQPQLNFSARGIVQLPQMYASQPISVTTGSAAPGTVSLGNPNLPGRDLFPGGAQVMASQNQAQALNQAQTPQAPNLPYQVASVGVPQPQHLQGPGSNMSNNGQQLLPGTAELMSQMGLQPQAQQQQQQQQQIHELLSSSIWDATLGFPAQAQPPVQAKRASASVPPQAASVSRSAVPQATLSSAAVGSHTNPPRKPDPSTGKRKRRASVPGHATLPVSEDEGERLKRRSERNAREQERSHRITERIAELKHVLSEAGVHFKPDRYSTLVSVVNYIKILQGRSKSLDDEHRRLLDTISGADRLANEGRVSGGVLSNGGSSAPMAGITTTVQTHRSLPPSSNASTAASASTDEEFLVFVQGIDYKSIFASCGVALAVASVDGRFVDCNDEFLRITDYTRRELLGDATVPRHVAWQRPAGQVVTVLTSTSAGSSMAVARTPDVPASDGESRSGSPPGPAERRGDGPPKEVRFRKPHHLSLFNLLGGEDMEKVYAAMSRMLRAPEPSAFHALSAHTLSASSLSRNVGSSKGGMDSGGTSSSSSDSFVKSDLTRSTEGDSGSSGNEVSGEGEGSGSGSGGISSATGTDAGGSGADFSRYTVDHWSGRVKHTRRKNHMLQLNISLVRTADGRPKFFNCALSEVE